MGTWICLLGVYIAQAPAQASGDSEASAAAEARFLSGSRQLTFEGRRSGEGYFSATGDKLIFQSEREPQNPFYQIYLMDLDLGDVTRVSTGVGKTTCSWIHPSGNKVLFASTHADPDARKKQADEYELRASGKQRRYAWDYDEHFDIYQHDLASGKNRNLTHVRGYDAEGSWSPDGKWIAFASNRHAFTETLSEADRKEFENQQQYMMEIYIMRADGSDVRRLTRAPGYDGGPFFSPDGKRICWRRFSRDGATAEIHTMKLDGTDQKQLTHLGAMSWAPFYHPSGEYLIFATNLQGFANFELYLVDAKGAHEPVRVTYTDGFDGLAAFSPDGRQLAWTSTRTADKQSQIYIAQWNHSEARRTLGLGDARVKGKTAVRRQSEQKAATSSKISPDDMRVYITRLASDEMEGRLTGTRGERLATQYVADQFKRLGLEPAGDDGTYFQEFSFTAGVDLGPKNAVVAQNQDALDVDTLVVNEDWRPLSFSRTGKIDPTGIVFAGYGITAPAADGFDAYDSYVNLDVKGKWVLVLRFMPEDVSAEQRQHLSRFSSLRYKAMLLRDKGAAGMIVVSGPTSQVAQQLVKLKFDATLSGTSIAAISLTDDAAQRLLASDGKDLSELQKSLDGGEPQPGFDLPRVKLAASIDIKKVTRTGRNVLARLSAAGDAARSEKRPPAVMVGAHVDHLGRGEGANSLARDDEKGRIHYGADDNASGTAGMLEIAEYLVGLHNSGKLHAKRDLLFAAWSGEELGLLGSAHYVDALAKRIGSTSDVSSSIGAYLNLDMIGRLRKGVVIDGVGSSPIWPREIERRNAPVGLSITPQNDSYLPTDATSFYLHHVPILSAFTGAHEDYHSPRDTADKINYEGAASIARFTALVARALALADDAPAYVEMTKPETRGDRAGLRAYVGTIPDYVESEQPGMKLSGVVKGGPAEQAGLRGGDFIVEIAGKKIENIYDYTYAIDAMKIGEPVEVVVRRGEERLKLSVTPTSRK